MGEQVTEVFTHDLIRGLVYPGVLLLGSKLYLFGGQYSEEQRLSKAVLELDLSTFSVRQVGELRDPGLNHAVVFNRGEFLVLTGETGREPLLSFFTRDFQRRDVKISTPIEF